MPYWLRVLRGMASLALVVTLSSLLTTFFLQRSTEEGGVTPVVTTETVRIRQSAPPTAGAERQNPSQETLIYRATNEAVVNITAESVDVVYDWFFQPQPRTNQSTGSGSIFDKQGYVITNSHVVKEADRLLITLHDGMQYEAEVKGIDYETDLALLKFDPGKKTLSTIVFGDSAYLEVGETVLAIGNPYGLERTLTKGIVSGLGRPIRNDAGIVIHNMIQTDASINPGNSGGPLLNLNGELVGINTSIYTPSGGSVGIGFALPINSAKRVVDELIRFGRVRRGWIEIEPIQLFPRLAHYASLPVEQGVLVSEVVEGGNADRAGLRGGSRNRAVRSGRTLIYLGGDIIVGLNGAPVKTLSDLYSQLTQSKPGDLVEVEYIRNGRRGKLKLELSERPS